MNSSNDSTRLMIINMFKYSLFNINDTIAYNDIFKKIEILFKGLCYILRDLLLKVDEKIYQDIKDKEISFPKNIEALIFTVATFDKAFDHDLIGLLFNVVSFPEYPEIYKISKIKPIMVPFVIDENIDLQNLLSDYRKFIIVVREFVTKVYNLNSNLDESIITHIDKDTNGK